MTTNQSTGEEATPLGRGEDFYLWQRVVAQYDAPAYVRRARQVQDAFDTLLGQCRKKRDELLEFVRLDLGTLQGLAGDWQRLSPYLLEESHVQILAKLYDDLAPQLRVPVHRTSSGWQLKRALRSLSQSVARFNERWQAAIEQLDLTGINTLRDGYNCYYLLEKECAVRAPHVARQGFRRLEPLTHEEMLREFPLLPDIRLSE